MILFDKAAHAFLKKAMTQPTEGLGLMIAKEFKTQEAMSFLNAFLNEGLELEQALQEAESKWVDEMQIPCGYIHPQLAGELDRPYVFVAGKKISAAQEILPLLRPDLLIVAEDIEGDALSTLLANSSLKVCAVKAKSFVECKPKRVIVEKDRTTIFGKCDVMRTAILEAHAMKEAILKSEVLIAN